MCCIDRTDRNVLSQSIYDKGNASNGLLYKYEELQTTLRVLLRTQEEYKRIMESKFECNIKQQIQPILERLKKSSLSTHQLSLIHLIEKQISHIVSAFSLKLSSKYFGLTPTEIRIAGLIRDGLTSKEIAEILIVSKECVDFHRNNIRKKLGISGKKANMRSFLLNITKGG
jgi:DNA-binding CsgD family transcriptional regulator